MAQNITIMGASYSAVPAVTLPKTGGGTASFTDVTDTTAAAADVAQGKYFYTAAGVRTQGTSSGGGSSMNVQVAQSTSRIANTAYTKACSLTCAVSGTYDVYWDCYRSSTSGTNGSQLYVGGNAYGTANTTFASSIHVQSNHLTGVSLTANQEVAVYVRSRSTSYYAYCGQLTIIQTA